MLLHSQILIECIMLRTNPKFFPDFLSLSFPKNRQIPIAWCHHPWKHRNSSSFASSIVTQQGKDLTLKHADSEVINGHNRFISGWKFLPQRNYFDGSVIYFLIFQSFINLFKILVIAWLVHNLIFSRHFFFKGNSWSVIIAAEKRMSFGSPLVGHNLVKIPSQNQVENYVQKEADHSCPNGIVVDVLPKGRGDLVRFSINHCSEG